jgi:hypothetical protein
MPAPIDGHEGLSGTRRVVDPLRSRVGGSPTGFKETDGQEVLVMRVAMMLVVFLLGSLAAASCGGGSGSGSSQSSADKAKNEACAAKSDINAQITTLKNLTVSTASVDTATTALAKIDTDLNTVATAVPDMTSSLKQQFESANATFRTQVNQVSNSINSAQSLSDATTALAAAGTTLASSYQQAFASVKC